MMRSWLMLWLMAAPMADRQFIIRPQHGVGTCNLTTAVSPTPAQVNTALSNIPVGQTVCIPDGTSNWTTAITIDAGKHLRGVNDCLYDANGRPTSCPTVIIDGATSNGDIIVTLNPSAGGSLTRLSHLEINKNNTANGRAVNIVGTGLNSYRVDHVRISNLLGRGFSVSSGGGVNFSGLIDHIYCKKTASGSPQCAEYVGSGGFDNSSMARGYTPGTNSAHYFEDNTVEYCCEGADSAVDAYGGAQYVLRYDILINTQTGHHGNDSGLFRGVRLFEYYNNVHTNSISTIPLAHLRSGGGFAFNETYTGSYSDFIPSVYRGCPQNFVDGSGNTYGPGDGTSTWDTNAGPHGYVYVDQVGWSFDNVAGHAPIHTPFYFWSVRDDGATVNAVPGEPGYYTTAYRDSNSVVPPCDANYHQTDFLQADREWFRENASFNGTSGVGIGLKATMTAIATCTQFTLFWVTDEGTWDNVHAGFDGQGYQCNASNTWVLYYTPYPYPHPLAAVA